MENLHNDAQTMMSSELKERLLARDESDVKCQLIHDDGMIVGGLCRIMLSDGELLVELECDESMLEDALGCSQIRKVCVILGDDTLYERMLVSTWVQTRDIMPHAYGNTELCFSASRKDGGAGA